MTNAQVVPSAPAENHKQSDFSREHVMTIPLSDIKVDPNWNARSLSDINANGDDDSGYSGLTGLITSIRTSGQDTAVDVVKNTTGTKHPWFLVAGFKRVEALRLISVEDKNATPTVQAIVKNLTPVGMRLLNLRENTARDNLKGADLAYGIAELERLDKNLTGVAIAEALNRSQPYVDKMRRINAKVKPELIKHWRETPGNPVTVSEMYSLSGKEPEEQEALYMAAFKPAVGDEKKPGDWKHAAKVKAEKVGTMLGTLEREFQLDCTILDSFVDCISVLVKLPEDVNARETKAVAKSCYEAYCAARDYVEPEETEETEETSKKSSKK